MENTRNMNLGGQKGSVMMEFIIVFPVYLILLAGTFMVGDLGIRSIWLPPADRVATYDLEEVNANGWTTMIGHLLNVPGQDQPSNRNYTHFSDTSFKGPWSFCAGAKAKDDYSLWQYSRGQLEAAEGIVGDSARNGNWDDMDGLLRGGTVEVYSKDELTERQYTFNFYTYKRVKYPKDKWKMTYRANPNNEDEAGKLVDAAYDDSPTWRTTVTAEGESWAEIGDGNTGNQKSGQFPVLTNRRYVRYQPFVDWSE